MLNESAKHNLAILAARYRASPLPAFFAWWRGELAALIPDHVRRRLMPQRPVIWIVPASTAAGDLEIWRAGDPPQRMDIFGAGEDPGLLRGRWLEALSRFEDGSPEVRLCLPASRFLAVPVTLPLAVETNLPRALSYQLDQLTPFRADQARYDFRVNNRDGEHGRIELDLRLAPLAEVTPLLDRLGAMGIRPHALDTLAENGNQPDPEGFNLFPETERPRYVYARARLNWALLTAGAILLGMVMVQSLYLRGKTVRSLEAQAAELRAEAHAVLELRQELEDALLAANFLAERRRQQPVAIEVLAEVTEILPDNIWLQQFRIQGRELMIQGLADGAQRLIELVNDSELLDNAEFRGAINVDPASGRERFNAAAVIQPRRERDETPAGT